ncbi:MAG: phosphoribosylglycinamide formyltransferase [Ignavibacteria bacterium]|jgi:formyltetrahydrofolate-dependent phosphoribosylglycinamide formyltransferase
MYRIAVFVSGRGSNLKSIYNYIKKENLRIEISAVVSNKSDCPAITFSKDNGIPTFVVNQTSNDGNVTYSDLIKIFNEKEVELIILAGYLKKIPEIFIDSFENKIINIHPALLPSFGGKGMYGINVHKAVFDSSAKVSGATIHFVNSEYDKGKIIAQKCVDLNGVASPEEIAGRVLEIEHELLPLVVRQFSENKIEIANNRVLIK